MRFPLVRNKSWIVFLKRRGERIARCAMATEAHPTSKLAETPISGDETSRKMGCPNLDVGHPAYSKREMATRISSARRRYSS